MTDTTMKTSASFGQANNAAAPAPRRNVDAMVAGGNNKPDTVRRKDIHDKWTKITDQEANAMTGKPDLVAMIQARYGLSLAHAQQDVDAWAKQRVF